MKNAKTPRAAAMLRGDSYHRVGTLTRQLHTVLSELGYAQRLHGSMEALPDTRSRLNYIERLSGDAAEKVLARVEMAKDEQTEIVLAMRRFVTQFARSPASAEQCEAAERMAELVEERNLRIDGHLTEIMLAQDFHDLTGQVISRVIETAAMLEEQLVQVLLAQAEGHAGAAAAPDAPGVARRTRAVRADRSTRGAKASSDAARPAGTAGPAIHADGTDALQNQKQVDDLLSSLGF